MKLSDEAEMVLDNKYGYRTDDQSEWYVPDDPVAIMTQETEDLGNDDILDTLNGQPPQIKIWGLMTLSCQAESRHQLT